MNDSDENPGCGMRTCRALFYGTVQMYNTVPYRRCTSWYHTRLLSVNRSAESLASPRNAARSMVVPYTMMRVQNATRFEESLPQYTVVQHT
jgi:hypothetical protein